MLSVTSTSPAGHVIVPLASRMGALKFSGAGMLGIFVAVSVGVSGTVTVGFSGFAPQLERRSIETRRKEYFIKKEERDKIFRNV